MDRMTAPWRVLEAPGPDPGGPPDGEGATAADGHQPDGSAGAFERWRPAALALVLVASIGLAAGAVVLSTPADGPGVVPGGLTAAAADGPTEIVVDVSGAVARPGVYRLAEGSRTADAIERAGGFGPRVDPATAARSLNLAAVLHDGDRVHVPSRDEARWAADPSAGAGGASGAGGAGGARPVDLNTASEQELDALPGIGPVTAGKIIAARREKPFTSIDELTGRKLVGQATFDRLRELVTVR